MTESVINSSPQLTVEEDKNKATIVYILQAIGFVVGVTFIAAVILNYVQRNELKTEIARSHSRWQIRTFWFSLLWSALGILSSMVLVGYFILLGNLIWTLYRVIKGWVRLNKSEPMYC